MKHKFEREYLSFREAEDLTGLSRWTLRRMDVDGRMATTRIGKRVLIPVVEIRRLAAEGMRPRRSEEARVAA